MTVAPETNVLVPLKFKDGGDAIKLKDKMVIAKIPVIERALSLQNDNWEKSETMLTEPISIPFLRASGEFLLEHVLRYNAPDSGDEFSSPEEYPEAMRKDLQELKDIIELANFLECNDFVQAIGFIIAKKLENKSVQEIADYMGVECLKEPDGYDEDNEWMHPPLAALQRNNAD